MVLYRTSGSTRVAANVLLTWLVVVAPAFAGEGGEPDLTTLSLEELMAIEVTSVTRGPEALGDAPSAIQVIPNDEIRRSGADTLPRALRLASNLAVAQKNSHDWAISARGFNTALANKMLVLIDGRSVYTPLFSGVFWNAQDVFLEDVDRIEVVSGPGGSVWGANAVNGVINVISRPAGETQGAFVQAGVGSQLEAMANVRWGGTLGERGHYRIWGRYADHADERREGGGSADDGWDRAATGFRVDGTAATNDRWTLQGDLYAGDDGLVEGGTARVRGANLLGRWTRARGEGSEISVQAYVDRTRVDLPVPALLLGGIPLAPAGELRDRLDTWDVDFQHRVAAGARHTLTWGAGFRYWESDVDNAPALAFLPPRHLHRLWSAFVQDQIRIRDAFELTLGTKLEHNDVTGFEAEPSVRLRWRPGERGMVWAAVSRAVRTPSRIDTELSQPAPPLVLLAGNPDFDSESVLAWELGARGRLGARATGSVAAFHNSWRNLRSTSATPATILPLFFENNLEGASRGIELRGRLQASERIRLRAGYTLLDHDLRVRSGALDVNDGHNETADPEHQLSLHAAVDFGRGFEADAGLRWVDQLPINSGLEVGEVPSYAELDLRLGWRATESVEFELVGTNLLDDDHPEYGYPGPNRVVVRRAVAGRLTWRP